jgi:hypothetical protein
MTIAYPLEFGERRFLEGEKREEKGRACCAVGIANAETCPEWRRKKTE